MYVLWSSLVDYNAGCTDCAAEAFQPLKYMGFMMASFVAVKSFVEPIKAELLSSVTSKIGNLAKNDVFRKQVAAS